MVTWTSENNEKLLVAILAVFKDKVDCAAVAVLIGQGCTERAVQEQIKKLKKVAALQYPPMANEAGTAAIASPAGGPVGTPQKRGPRGQGSRQRKRKRITTARAKSTSKTGSMPSANDDDGDD